MLSAIRKPFHFSASRFLKDQQGTTAIEFSLLAVPFVFTVVSIIELSLFFATSSVIDGALNVVARQVRTGQIQNQASSTDEMMEIFKDIVCEHGDALTVCNKIEFEVVKLDAFTNDIAASVTAEGGLNEPAFELDQTTAGCVALIRLSYLYSFMTPLFGSLWSNYPDSQRLILSTTVIKTEPYDFEVDEGCTI